MSPRGCFPRLMRTRVESGEVLTVGADVGRRLLRRQDVRDGGEGVGWVVFGRECDFVEEGVEVGESREREKRAVKLEREGDSGSCGKGRGWPRGYRTAEVTTMIRAEVARSM